MTDRSVRVTLSASTAGYIAEMQRSAKATREIAVAANDVKTHLHALGSIPGLATLARDLGKVKTALTGMSNLQDLARLTTGLHTLSTAGAGLTTAVNDIRRLSTAMRGVADPAAAAGIRSFASAMHGLGSLGTGTASTEITAMSAGIRRLIRDANSVPALRALAAAIRDLGAAGNGLGNLGGASGSLRGMQAQIDQLRRSVAGLRNAGGSGGGSGGSGGFLGGSGSIGRLAGYAAGYLALGSAIKSTYKQTADYETEINTFGAVTKTSGAQLKEVSALALKLGGDVTIAGASASDAATALTELAKGGLSVAASMAAAKGTLQLAAAAEVDASTAAGIQTAALNSFGLNASEAGKVADILANTAAAASGEITDFAEGMKQSGEVAHGFGMSLLDNQTILAQFAQAGIKGSMGGNILKSALLSVERASGPSGKALKEMGVEVKNSNGTYITAAQLEEQLAQAKKRLGTTAFNTAAAVAFGTRGVIFANVAADNGAKGFDKMSTAIQGGAGAAAFSAAKMSGLGGAVKNIQNQIETAQVVLGEKFSPTLTTVGNQLAAFIPKLTGFLTGASLGGGIASVGNYLKPLVSGAGELMSKAWPYIRDFSASIGRGFESIVHAVKPVIDAIGGFFKTAVSNGSIDKLGAVLTGIGHGFEAVGRFLIPIGTAIGSAVKWFGNLGPVATTLAVALGAVAATRLGLGLLMRINFLGFGTAVRGAQGAAVGFRATMLGLQSAGIGRIGSALGAATQSVAGFGKGLLGMFGGPWGLAITAVTTFLAFLPQLIGGDQSAADAAKNHSDAVNSLADAFQTSNGLIDQNVRKTALAQLQSAAWGKSSTDLTSYAGQLHAAGVSTRDLVDGMLGIAGASGRVEKAYQDQRGALEGVITAGTRSLKNGGVYFTDQAKAAKATLTILDQQHAAYQGLVGVQSDAAAKAKENADAIKGLAAVGSGGVKLLGTNTGDMTLALQAAQIQASKTATAVASIGAAAPSVATTGRSIDDLMASAASSDLHAMQASVSGVNDAASIATLSVSAFARAVDILTGRNVPLEEATKNLNDTIRATATAFNEAAHTAGFHASALISTTGVINTTTKAGSDLYDSVTKYKDAYDTSVVAAEKAAGANATVAQKVAAAKASADASYSTFIAMAKNLGLNDTQAQALANHMGILEGKKLTPKTLNLRAQDDATAKVDALNAKVQGLQDKTVTLTVKQQGALAGITTGGKDASATVAATGGYISGPGSGTSDSIPARLSNGEFVIRAAQVAKHRPLLDAINSGGQGFAAGGPVGTVRMVSTGDAAASVSSALSALYKSADAAAQSANAATAAANAAVSAVPAASSAGVSQWIPLMTKVITEKLGAAAVASVLPVMAAQMQHESGGNPAAINNYDINAQHGDPSRGLLQFIMSTFRRFADPGYNTNIYDPESQMRAFINYVPANYGSFDYLTRIGNGAYADGGYVSGPGGPRSDSVPARLSNGEFVVNAAATAKHLGLLQAVNGYAGGGVVGSALALSGRTAATVGPELSQVVQALQDIATAVEDAANLAHDKAVARNESFNKLTDAQARAKATDADALARFNDAKKRASITNANTSASVSDMRKRQAAADDAAQARIDAAKTASARQSAIAAKAALDARQALSLASAARSGSAQDQRQAITLEAAQRAYDKTKAAQALSVSKAQKEYDDAKRTATAYAKASDAAKAYQASQQRQYQAQQARAAQVDMLTTRLGTATDNLATMRSDRAGMASGIASGVTGFDGGITGHSDTRTTAAQVIAGQQYDLARAQKFQTDLAKDKKLGVNATSLSQIAAAGIDGGGVTAAALAGGSKSQIAAFNATQSHLGGVAAKTGDIVAGQFYDAGIAAAKGLVNGLSSQIGTIQKVMNSVANMVTGTLTKKLQIHSPSKVMHELGGFTAKGYMNGILAHTGGVSAAMNGLVQVPGVPNIPNQGAFRQAAPTFNVKVFVGNKEITDIARVEVLNGMNDLSNAALVYAGRPQ